MCIRDSYYVARMLAGVNGRRDSLYAKKTTVITPAPAHVNISAGGVAKYSGNKAEAVKLLEFLASPEGSKGLAAPTFEHPLKEVNQNQIVKDFGEFTPDKVTIDQLGDNNSIAFHQIKILHNNLTGNQLGQTENWTGNTFRTITANNQGFDLIDGINIFYISNSSNDQNSSF